MNVSLVTEASSGAVSMSSSVKPVSGVEISSNTESLQNYVKSLSNLLLFFGKTSSIILKVVRFTSNFFGSLMMRKTLQNLQPQKGNYIKYENA